MGFQLFLCFFGFFGRESKISTRFGDRGQELLRGELREERHEAQEASHTALAWLSQREAERNEEETEGSRTSNTIVCLSMFFFLFWSCFLFSKGFLFGNKRKRSSFCLRGEGLRGSWGLAPMQRRPGGFAGGGGGAASTRRSTGAVGQERRGKENRNRNRQKKTVLICRSRKLLCVLYS